MARILTQSSDIKPININTFLGLNMATGGDTQLLLGESGDMYNCYVTKDYNLSKAMGYLQLMTTGGAKSIQGMWYGNLGGTNYFIFAFNGHIYRFANDYWLDDSTWTTFATATVDLGTLTDAKTNFFEFGDSLYIQNGVEYKKWTGTGTISDVAGYVPKIRIACEPLTGAGTDYEGINLLTGKKRLTYKADNTAVYQLPETAITSVDSVYVNGVLKTVTTHYTVNLTNGTVTFTAGNFPAPVADEDEVEIYYTKGVGSREVVVQNKQSFIFSQAVDSRVFMYGHTVKNQRIYSSLADGIPSAEYFTATSVDLIGESSMPITDMKQQQTDILLFKTSETYYSYYNTVNLDGIDVVNFPTTIINSTRGAKAFNQGQLLNNEVYTIDNTFIKWYPTTIKDERNMKEMGMRIQKDLDEYDLADVVTVDYQKRYEMWIAIGKKIWIYNYNLKNPETKEQGIFSRLYIEHTPTCFITINGEIYFGTTDGRIMKFSDDYLTYNGYTILSHWEMNMYNFGADYKTKTLNKSWITLSAQPNVAVDLKYVTDKDTDPSVETKTYSLITFDDVDFANFTFLTNYNPQVFYITLKAKKFTYLKLVIENASATETFVVLNFTMKAEYGGDSK